jgi:hypothetical protein
MDNIKEQDQGDLNKKLISVQEVLQKIQKILQVRESETEYIVGGAKVTKHPSSGLFLQLSLYIPSLVL